MMKGRGLAVILAVVFLTGCGSGISQADYDAAISARDEAVAELSTVKTELDEALKKEAAPVEVSAVDDVAISKAAAKSAAEAEYRAIGELMRLAERFTGTSADDVITAYGKSYDAYITSLDSAGSSTEVSLFKSAWDEQVTNVYETLAAMDTGKAKSGKTTSTVPSGATVYNDNDIVMNYTGYEVDGSKVKFNFNVEDNGDSDITIYFSDTSIDGYMVGVTAAIDVSAGKKANTYAFTFTSYLEDNGLDPQAIENLEGNLRIKDKSSDGYIEKAYPFTVEVQQ